MALSEAPTPATAGLRWSGTYSAGCYSVTVQPHGLRVIERTLTSVSETDEGWHHDRYIWPGWAPKITEFQVDARSPLEDVHDYWDRASRRIRDSARWMASVIGTTLGALIATSPLAQSHDHHLTVHAGIVGGIGLVFLMATLILILQVLIPHSVSFIQILNARPGRLRILIKLRDDVCDNHDLYLPCGITTLQGLQSAITVEEITLMALADASHGQTLGEADLLLIQNAEEGRAARLRELRKTMSSIALLGEFYTLRRLSRIATFCGPFFSAVAAMCIITSVALTYR